MKAAPEALVQLFLYQCELSLPVYPPGGAEGMVGPQPLVHARWPRAVINLSARSRASPTERVAAVVTSKNAPS